MNGYVMLTRVAVSTAVLACCATATAAQSAPTFDGGSLEAIRRVAAEVDGPRPVAVHVLAVNTFTAHLSGLVEGAETRPVAAMNAVFQIRFADYWIMVDAAADSTMLGGPGFSPAAFDTALLGLSGARAIVLTHEHHDHVGGIFQAADSLAIAARTLMTAEQRRTLETAPNRPAIRLDSTRAARFQPFAYERAVQIAPGVVLIKAPGHTPGSQLVYVHLASGDEIVLAGDVAWMMAGIRDGRQKPPNVSANVALLGVAEDRVQIARQLDWLRSVGARGVHVVVAHDRTAVDELVERGVLTAGLDLGASHAGRRAETRGTFDAAGVTLEYEVHGSGRPVVLVPGWTQSLRTWDGQVTELAQHFSVIRYNRGPWGLSTDPADLIALLDHLQLERITLVGHSVGAGAALRFAASQPERVDALVIYGPTGAPGLAVPWHGLDSWAAHFRRLGVTDDPFASVAAIGIDSVLALARLHPLFTIPDDRPEARQRLEAIWAEYQGSDLLTPPVLDPATRAPTVADLARLGPALVITGTDELPYFRLAADVLHYALPDAWRVIVPGGGHMVHLVAPAAFTAALLEFLLSASLRASEGLTNALPDGPQAGVLRGPDLDVAYVEWPGHGTPMVLIHGLGGNALWWAGLVAALPNRHVIAIDLPGHGQSPAVEDWALAPLASRIAEAVAQRWAGPVVWGGHSWGGKIAVLAAAAPPSAAGLVLLDPVPLAGATIPDFGAVADFLFAGEFEPWPDIEVAIAAVRLLPAYRTWTSQLEQAFRRGTRVAEDGQVVPLLTRDLAIDVLRAAYAGSVVEHANALDVPVLLMMAEDSRRFQASNIASLPRAEHVFVPGNHWIHVNSIQATAAAIADWLATSSARLPL
jgi:pimeloyl-ACP methyl ester carboxylesterase/glyoxylase-like metal-dependent hydrolase (beta-lactamase superfamily II)